MVSGYRGEVMLKYKPTLFKTLADNILQRLWNKIMKKIDVTKIQYYYDSNLAYEVGDRVGQMIIMPYPTIEFEQAEELTKTERGEGGYGSTGK